MKQRVEFVGGPMDGDVKRISRHRIYKFVALEYGERVYYYRASVTADSKPLRQKVRYVFCGHRYVLNESEME